MITYIICAALLIVCIIGAKAIIKQRGHKKKQQAIATTYDRLVRESKLAIEYSDFFCNRYIGLDQRNKKLVLIDHCNGEKQELCIPLMQVKDSEIIHVKDELESIKTIVLELRNKRNNEPVQFCFYNNEYDSVIELPTLSRKAIHWKTKIDIHKHPGKANLEEKYFL